VKNEEKIFLPLLLFLSFSLLADLSLLWKVRVSCEPKELNGRGDKVMGRDGLEM